MVFPRRELRIEGTVIRALREYLTKYYVEKKVSDDEYWIALKFGYMTLRSQLNNAGLAENLKPEMVRFWRNTKNKELVGDWWLAFLGKKKDYDLVEYDTGDPLELAEKIYLAGVRRHPESKVEKLYNIAMGWAVGDFDFEDREGVMKLAQFIAILSWSGYSFDDEFEKLKEQVKAIVENEYSDDKELRYIVLGDRSVVKAFDKLLMFKPWAWLSWKDNVR